MFKYLVVSISSFCVCACFATETWLPHLTRTGGGFNSQIDMINTDFVTKHAIELQPYTENGQAIALPRSLELEPGERRSVTIQQLGWPDQVSHVRVSHGDEVRLSTIYTSLSTPAMPATVPGLQDLIQVGRFIPATEGPWFDGIALTNAKDQSIQINLTIHDAAGNTLETVQLNLAAYSKWLGVLTQVFSAQPHADGYIEVRADSPLLMIALRGTLPGTSPAVLTSISMDNYESQPAPLTWANQASRILQRKCEGCHHVGGIGPFPFTTYDQTSSLAPYIHLVVSDNQMPPWRADDACNDYVASYALDTAEKEMLLQWASQGTERGDVQREPAPIAYEQAEWTAGQPDVVLQYDEPFYMSPGDDIYRCFPVPLNNEETLYVKSIEIMPGNLEVVHHVLLYLETDQDGLNNDLADEGPGYTCFGGPNTSTVRLMAGWAPGMKAIVFPDNVGMTIPPNSTAIMQVHYHYSNSPGFDHTQIGLHLVADKPSKELLLLPLVNQEFTIPADAKNYLVEESIKLPFFLTAELYTIAPHMHLLGQRISVKAEHTDGTELCLVDVPRWDFEWQRFYEFQQPITLEGNTTLRLQCEFDNSIDNPYNPNTPPKPVSWGEATTDEMALCFLGIVLPFEFTSAKLNPWGWEWPYKIGN